MGIKVIDISKWQGDINISKVKAAVSGVICKATEGVGYTDPQFKNNQSKLRSNDIPRGYYHFARPDLGNSPESEADWFLKTVGPLQKGEILALDAENAPNKSYSNWATWSYAFLKRIESKLGGYKPMIYINLNFNNIYDWSAVASNNNGLWLALWDNKPDYRPKTDWPLIAMKQYGPIKVDGISGDVDGNNFFGDVETFKKYGYQTEAPNDPVDNGNASELEALRKENIELKSTIQGLSEDISTLNSELKMRKEENTQLSNEITTLTIAKNTAENDKIEAISQLNAFKKSRFIWIVKALENIFPEKKK